jgi:hypothetical protein
MEHDKQIPIWFFIGVLLTVYGILIFASGLYGWAHPPPKAAQVALWGLHADLWWGALLVIIGGIYVTRFRPGRTGGS